MIELEYRVTPVTRYHVTRYHGLGNGSGGVESKGTFDQAAVAYEVAYALCKEEHQKRGWPVGDERIKYPSIATEGKAILGD